MAGYKAAQSSTVGGTGRSGGGVPVLWQWDGADGNTDENRD